MRVFFLTPTPCHANNVMQNHWQKRTTTMTTQRTSLSVNHRFFNFLFLLTLSAVLPGCNYYYRDHHPLPQVQDTPPHVGYPSQVTIIMLWQWQWDGSCHVTHTHSGMGPKVFLFSLLKVTNPFFPMCLYWACNNNIKIWREYIEVKVFEDEKSVFEGEFVLWRYPR